VAAAVAAEIRKKMLRIAQNPKRVDPEAYDAYVRGRYFWNIRNESALKTAIQHFEQALAHDPAYAPAYSGLADSHFYLGYAFGRVPPNEAMPRARAAALKSVELDDQLAEGHTSLALVRFIYDWDWAGAEQEFRRAISLNPSYALAHHGLAVLLMTTGRRQEAVSEANNALAVDPLSLPINGIVVSMLVIAGRYDEAIKASQRMLELRPDFGGAHEGLGNTYQALGRDTDALREFLESKRLNGVAPDLIATLRHAYEDRGWRGYYERELQLKVQRFNGWHADAFGLASLCARVGDKSGALRWLDVAYKAKSGLLVWLPSDDALNRVLAQEPQYHRLLVAMRLSSPQSVTPSTGR
jgi:tetratricopeptide (TPR) repeat protein